MEKFEFNLSIQELEKRTYRDSLKANALNEL